MEFSILPPVTIPTKTIKVDDATHRRLKLMAAQTGEHLYEVVARLVSDGRGKATMETQRKGKR